MVNNHNHLVTKMGRYIEYQTMQLGPTRIQYAHTIDGTMEEVADQLTRGQIISWTGQLANWTTRGQPTCGKPNRGLVNTQTGQLADRALHSVLSRIRS